MTKRQLDQLTDLSHLLAATTNVVIANLVKVTLLILALNGLALAVDDCVLGNDAILRGVDLDNLKFNLTHTTTYGKQVTLANWAVGLTEVGGEEDVEDGSGQTLNSIGNRKDSNALSLVRGQGISINQKQQTKENTPFR